MPGYYSATRNRPVPGATLTSVEPEASRVVEREVGRDQDRSRGLRPDRTDDAPAASARARRALRRGRALRPLARDAPPRRRSLRDREAASRLPRSDSHGQVIVDALRAGKHVFAEKPICYTLREADEILAAQARAGAVCMIAYMKRYDPAFRYAAPLIERLPDLQAIDITVLHPSEANQTAHHDLRRFADVPADARARLRADQDRLIREAIGDFTALERRVFAGNLLSTLVHDINLLRRLSGDPVEVLFTDVWAGGDSMTTFLRYASGVRATINLHYLRDLADYEDATCRRKCSSKAWRTGILSRSA
ncbi:MAG: hypothetical protein DMD81_05310 [Candidatus Rokuibacteriota bacterium]|nr:MAG: hypothetical protein DMD81_05310 [Candidatus Rokubacteria bacterium]